MDLYTNKQMILKMLNATLDEMFLAIARGGATNESCRDDRDYLLDIREKFDAADKEGFDFIEASNDLIFLFEKYRAKSINTFLPI
ncbi:nicotinate phosphoribosyltransferase [Campylobacter sp. RM13119]|uniref:nicotinate phosphoribosyltransferase n=1 Tax=Campylobacter TaxID=194 RepID=UPI00147474BE|nr:MULTISPECIES: nicotinate phosphoribosyltransferase [unclassified Campylobacter]MBE3606848.1 nicotinate phosphoribosyltransferase [Campylobacter sp. RM13119]